MYRPQRNAAARVELSADARDALRPLPRAEVDDLLHVAASLVDGEPGHGVLARGDFLVFFRRLADRLVLERIKPARGPERPDV